MMIDLFVAYIVDLIWYKYEKLYEIYNCIKNYCCLMISTEWNTLMRSL